MNEASRRSFFPVSRCGMMMPEIGDRGSGIRQTANAGQTPVHTVREVRMAVKLFSEIPYLQDGNLILKRLDLKDAEGLKELVDDPVVFRYLPTFLFEKKYEDIRYVIDHLYDECFRESIILGVFQDEEFCGLAEFYGLRDEIHKISVGYRLLRRKWGRGIATDTLRLMVRYLYDETDIEIITASTMVENRASARVLEKNGFDLVISGADEDWGYEGPTPTDKWIR